VSSAIDGYELHAVSIPMRHRFRGVSHREAVLIHGQAGWGEFSPFPEYSIDVARRWLAAAIELATVEMPPPVRSVVPVNVTIPAVSPDVAYTLALESGANTAKIKIAGEGTNEGADVDRISAVRDALGPDGHIRVDVNAGWDLETATRRLGELERWDLQYVEQPVTTVEEMVELRKRTDVPIAADEIVRNAENPLEIVERGAADVLILKVQPMGGVEVVLDLARRCEIPVVISSALETSVGMYGGVAAAAAMASLPYACGLGTVALLKADPTVDPLVAVSGLIEVRRPVPDPDLLERWRPDCSTEHRLLDRLRETANSLP
jgi:O-succinylbenzoate synthase